jgi:tRNA threonylcarbamoyladenosine biosynthesis protein TsaE
MQKQVITKTSDETELLGEAIGRALRGGEVIELRSDLGGGKTTLTKGIARGFGSLDKVASPSFTISREYEAGDKRIVHFDLYRLDDAGIMKDEIAELVNDPAVVVIVEWADVVSDVLPENRISITIEYIDDTSRRITLRVPPEYEYITQEIN